MAKAKLFVAERRIPTPDGEGEYRFRLRENGSVVFRRPYTKVWHWLAKAHTYSDPRNNLPAVKRFETASLEELLGWLHRS